MSSELEEALLVMPFSEVTELLRLLDLWITVAGILAGREGGGRVEGFMFSSVLQRGWEIELSCRCLFFLLRCVALKHHGHSLSITHTHTYKHTHGCRVHHHQITSSPDLLPIVDSLRSHTHQEVDKLRVSLPQQVSEREREQVYGLRCLQSTQEALIPSAFKGQ